MIFRREFDDPGVDDHLSDFLEIHGDEISGDGLHLADSPVRPFRMTNEFTRSQQRIQAVPATLTR